MRNIILTSCGIINNELKADFYQIIGKNNLESAKVLYITTASDGEPYDDKQWMHDEYQTILNLGFKKDNIVEYKIGKPNDDIDDFDVMYMLGGNTFYLLDAIRKTHFNQVIENFINAGKIYIGSSAGSEILGNSIEPAVGYDENNVGLTDLSGLKIVNGLIVPHCNRKGEYINNLKNTSAEQLFLLYDGDGVIIH